MSHKYKVIAIAYKNVDSKVEDILNKNCVKTIESVQDLAHVHNFGAKGFNLNNRIEIYEDWFEKEAKEKLNQGYKVIILEVPFSVAEGREALLRELDINFQEDFLVLDTVDV